MDLEGKTVDSKSNLEVILPIVPQSHCHPLRCPNLGIEVNTTREALLSFQMSKLRSKAIYDIFFMDAWYLFLRRTLKFGSNIFFS